MKRYALTFILATICFCGLFSTEAAPAENKTAAPTAAIISVDGKPQALGAYLIDGNNYFKLRDIAAILNGTSGQFAVSWDGSENAMDITTGRKYTGGEMQPVSATGVKNSTSLHSPIYIDGRAVMLTGYAIDGNTYFKLRDLGAYLGFGVGWNDSAKTIEISTTKGSGVKEKTVIGIHTSVGNDEEAQMLVKGIKGLAAQGVNLIVVEVGYSYQYTSRTELAAQDGLSFIYARKIAAEAKKYGIEVVPELDCLGHQSWEEYTGALLSVYPQLDETPGQYPNNEGIYCRSWCPLNPDIAPIIFDLIDELMDAFQADAFHVGMDEVFIIGDASCPRCRENDTGDLFLEQVNDLYRHIVVDKGATMYMWSDRLLDGEAVGDVYSEWDASYNGTYTAIDQIPKDIVLCDWHYDELDHYPSIQYFADKGFKVLTCSWNDADAAESFIRDTMEARKTNANVLGHLYTTWGDIANDNLADWAPLKATIGMLKEND